MATEVSRILEAAQTGFTTQEVELTTERERQMRSVVVRRATGSVNLDQTFGLPPGVYQVSFFGRQRRRGLDHSDRLGDWVGV